MKIFFSFVVAHKTLVNILHHGNCRKHKTDPALDVGETKPLDSSAQKHKLAVKPKKRHAGSTHRSMSPKKFTPKPGER